MTLIIAEERCFGELKNKDFCRGAPPPGSSLFSV